VTENLRAAALHYHAQPVPGKIATALTKPADTQADLALAYSPGVAYPCLEIQADPEAAYRYTGKGNLVAVISNGTAVLGLGDIGPLAGKPVMEGKALLFKRFAGIDAVDIEVDAAEVSSFVDTVARIAISFGGINLEDIKAPECFAIEAALAERCDIPVFHDDQHGTAIVTAAALMNALDIQGKSLRRARIVCVGAGSAAIACMRLLVSLGVPRQHILMLDRQGVIHAGRSGVNIYKQEFAHPDTDRRSLEEACRDADVLIGLSGANLFTPEMIQSLAPRPVIFACSNPDPEITPELAHSLRDDLVMATGRSDHPNQVNNVLGFPYIFRGALDVRARDITVEMKMAAVEALRDLAREPVPESVLQATGMYELAYGPSYIIPKPMDPRLLHTVSGAVARAAVASGAARLPLPDYARAE
jgi:malate dehydrogenase (oxaloacetate-decarboxylating)(NADP+)